MGLVLYLRNPFKIGAVCGGFFPIFGVEIASTRYDGALWIGMRGRPLTTNTLEMYSYPLHTYNSQNHGILQGYISSANMQRLT
jgi:hypothetical protein